MKKNCYFISIIISLVIILGYILTYSNNTFNTIKQQTVKIKVLAKQSDEYRSNEWQGSGIFISDNLILTAGHIVKNAEVIDVILPNGDCFKARNWYLEDESQTDLGFIDVNTPQKEKIVQLVDVKVGEAVWALGNPFGFYPSLTKGIISRLNLKGLEDNALQDNYFGSKGLILTDCPLNPGNSGCPLFNNRGIVGICVGGFPGANNVSFCIPAKVCLLSLNKCYATKALEVYDEASE